MWAKERFLVGFEGLNGSLTSLTAESIPSLTCVILLSFRTSMADNHNANIHTGNRNFNPSVGLRPGVPQHVARLPQF